MAASRLRHGGKGTSVVIRLVEDSFIEGTHGAVEEYPAISTPHFVQRCLSLAKPSLFLQVHRKCLRRGQVAFAMPLICWAGLASRRRLHGAISQVWWVIKWQQ